MGLDLGTGFVKCVSDYGSVRFPSVYVRRIHGNWTVKTTEAVGRSAMNMIGTAGAHTIRPIEKGKPSTKYQKQVEMLVHESISQVRKCAKTPVDINEKIRIAVGLPYHAYDSKDAITRIVKKILNVEECNVVAQASGTLLDLGMLDGIVMSIGQGTTEIIVIDQMEVIDGESSTWASDFITKKIGKFAHLDVDKLNQNKDTCKKYAKILAENLAQEVSEMEASYHDQYPIAISGGGLLIPGMHDELFANLKKFKLMIPNDPVMSNAMGLYKFVR